MSERGEPKVTPSIVAVLDALVASDEPLDIRAIAQASGRSSGTVAQIVVQLTCHHRWTTSAWEHSEAQGSRRCYLLTIRGRQEAEALLATDQAQRARPRRDRVNVSFTPFEANALKAMVDAAVGHGWLAAVSTSEAKAGLRGYDRLKLAIRDVGATL